MLQKYLNEAMKKTACWCDGDGRIMQTALAQELGVTRSAVCLWLQGSRTPNIRILKKLIDYISSQTKRSKRVITHEMMAAVFADLEEVA
tara:strand:- start:660 stop:926 length:267 start_codon:yes stop_codon:yes gene_type:complete